MKNLLNSIDTAAVFVDMNLNIKRFTQQATGLINLIPADIGRPLAHIASKIKYPYFIHDVENVIRTLEPRDVPVESTEGRWFQMRIIPYRTLENVMDGAAITFLDTSRQKLLEQQIEQAKTDRAAVDARFDSVLAIAHESVLMLDNEFRILSASAQFFQAFGVHPLKSIGQHLFSVNAGDWDFPEMRNFLKSLNDDLRRSDKVMEHKFRFAPATRISAEGVSTGEGKSRVITVAFRELQSRMVPN
jgi:two-component system CheB/CheR fusion protein